MSIFFYTSGKWEAPMSGTKRIRPRPVGAHTFTKFDSHRALFHGGRTEDGRIDETWLFDLDRRVQQSYFI